MNKEREIFKGEKKCKSISIEFSCGCGKEFEVEIKQKDALEKEGEQ